MADVQCVEQIPVDILLDILLRLPAKSLGRFVCVSKLWRTIICGEDFIRSFSFRSSLKKHPRFLLSFHNETTSQENWHFFSTSTLQSTPAPGPPGLTSLFAISVAEREPKHIALMIEEETKAKVKVESIPPDSLSSTVCHLKKKWRYFKPSYAHGLISFLYGDEQFVTNPTTGKSITLPTPTFQSEEMIVRSYLGYDPVDARYKVLCLTNVKRFSEQQVLTLGSSETQNWRMIKCSIPHCALGSGSVCIDGVLYYTASASFTRQEPFLAKFDLRSETLDIASMFPNGIETLDWNKTTLINCNGKVAFVARCLPYNHNHGLWVLENADKQEWSIYDVSFSYLGNEKYHGGLELLGTSDEGEFIFAPTGFKELLYLYFMDHKSNKIKSIQLQGSTDPDFPGSRRQSSGSGVFTLMDHVESLMFI